MDLSTYDGDLNVDNIVTNTLTVNNTSNLNGDTFINGDDIDSYITNVVTANPDIGKTEYGVSGTDRRYNIIEDNNPTQSLYEFGAAGGTFPSQIVNIPGNFLYQIDSF